MPRLYTGRLGGEPPRPICTQTTNIQARTKRKPRPASLPGDAACASSRLPAQFFTLRGLLVCPDCASNMGNRRTQDRRRDQRGSQRAAVRTGTSACFFSMLLAQSGHTSQAAQGVRTGPQSDEAQAASPGKLAGRGFRFVRAWMLVVACKWASVVRRPVYQCKVVGMRPMQVHHVAVKVADLARAGGFLRHRAWSAVLRRWPADGVANDRLARSRRGAFLALERANGTSPRRPTTPLAFTWWPCTSRAANAKAWIAKLAQAGHPVYQQTDYTIYRGATPKAIASGFRTGRKDADRSLLG